MLLDIQEEEGCIFNEIMLKEDEDKEEVIQEELVHKKRKRESKT